MRPAFEIFKRKDGFGWRLKAGNGEVVAIGEGYTRREDADRAVRSVIGVVLEVYDEAGTISGVGVEEA